MRIPNSRNIVVARARCGCASSPEPVRVLSRLGAANHLGDVRAGFGESAELAETPDGSPKSASPAGALRNARGLAQVVQSALEGDRGLDKGRSLAQSLARRMSGARPREAQKARMR